MSTGEPATRALEGDRLNDSRTLGILRSSRTPVLSETQSRMRVLLLEDDKKMAAFIASGLEREGMRVSHFRTGEELLEGPEANSCDVAIIDIMLPGIDGLEVIGKLRARSHFFPVLILSAKSSVDDRVRGLRHGGDDYLTKPFSFEELVARVQTLNRRASGPTGNTLTFEEISLDRLSRRAARLENEIELQPREFLLLELFLSNPNRVLTKNILLEKIWQYGFDPQTNVVDVLVCRLRSKIDADYEHKYIHTLRGIGYLFGAKPSRGRVEAK